MPSDKAIEFLEKWFFSLKGLFFGLFIFAIFYITCLFSFVEKLTSISAALYIGVAFLLVYGVVWYIVNYSLPKSQKEFGGIVLSFKYQNTKQKERIEIDIADAIRNLVHSDIVDILVLKEHQVRRVNKIVHAFQNNKVKAKKRLNKLKRQTKYLLLIFGSIKERKQGTNNYFVEFNFCLSHSPVDQKVSLGIANIMGMFPRNFQINENCEGFGFQFASYEMSLAVKYISGLAMLLTNKTEYVRYALSLFEEIYEPIRKDKFLSKNMRLQSNFNVMYRNAYYLLLGDLIRNDKLDEALLVVNKALIRMPADYYLLISKSTLEFEVNRNTVEALRTIEKMKRYSKGDTTWVYSKIFILLYTNEIIQVLPLLEMLKDKKFRNEDLVANQCVDFDKKIIENEPDKVQLLFIIGFIYYYKLGKPLEALRYFDEFIDRVSGKLIYTQLISRANRYRDTLRDRCMREEAADA